MELFKLFGTIAVNNDEANQNIDETTGRAESAESKMSAAFKKIGAAVATYFAVDKIISFGKEIVNVAAEVDAEASAFGQIMGNYSDTAREKLNAVADTTGVMSTRMQGHFTSLSAKFKGLGFDVQSATDYAARGLTLAADASAFWDVSLDDASSHLNSFINGSYEGGEAIGLFANDTQMAMYAVQQGIVESTSAWASLDEATKQATRLEYAENMYKQSGATGQAAREADQYANVQANLTEKWRQFKAEIGEPLLENVVLPAMEKLSGAVDKASKAFQDAKQWVSEHETQLQGLSGVVIGLTTAVGAFVLIMNFGSIMSAAKSALSGVKTAMLGVNAAMTANPIALVVAAIAGLVAAFIYLWNNCESFRNFWIGLWDGIKGAAKAVADWLKQAWTDIGNFFTGTVPGWFNSFKDFFSNLWNGIKNTCTNVFNAIKDVVTTVFNAVKDFITNVWNGIKNTITNVVNAIKNTVSNVFNSVKSTVINIFNSIKNTATNVWNGIKSAITNPVETAKNIVKSQIDKIKGFFDNLKIKFPDIKLPHFSITGSFSLFPPSVPHLSVDWYAKAMDNAMLLNSPTIFGMNGAGQLMGGGEAGQEVVAGSNTLMNMIRGAVQTETSGVADRLERLISMLAEYLPEITMNSNRQLVLDTGVLAGQLAPTMDSKLGDISRLRGRGR